MITLTLIAVLLSSCSAQINIGDLPGTWQVVNFVANTPIISAELTESAKAIALSSVYTFKEDSTFEMSSDFVPKGESGNWQFLAKEGMIRMDYKPGGQVTLEEYKLELLTANTMRWTQDMGDLGTLTMVLKKE